VTRSCSWCHQSSASMFKQGRLVGTLRCLVRLSFDHVLQPWPVAAPSIDVLIMHLTPTTSETKVGVRSSDPHLTPARPKPNRVTYSPRGRHFGAIDGHRAQSSPRSCALLRRTAPSRAASLSRSGSVSRETRGHLPFVSSFRTPSTGAQYETARQMTVPLV